MKNIILLLIVSVSLSIAQEGEWKQYLPEYKHIPDGLQVNVINIDRYNNRWYGTDGYSNINGTVGGLAKFDGESWTQYTITNSNLPDNNITAIGFDLQDNIWIGMRDSGLAILKNDTIFITREPLQFIERGWIKKILTDKKGNIWALYRDVKYPERVYKPSALMKFDGESWKNYNLDSIKVPEEQINDITLDKDDNLYCGSQDKILKYDGSNWTYIEMPGEERRLHVSYLTFDSEGVLWVGTNGFESPMLLLYDNGLWKNTSDIYKGGEPNKILFDNLGNTWISSLSQGAGLFAEKGLAKYTDNKWQYYYRDNSAILYDNLTTIALDSTGVLWCGTPFGACTFDDDNWKYYGSSNGIPEKGVNKVVVDYNNNKWVATNNFGLAMYDGNIWQTYNKSNSGIPFNNIFDFEIDSKGNIWVATAGGGLGKFDGNTWIIYNQANTGYPIDKVFKIKLDSKGRIWLTTFWENTLLSFDGSDWQVFNSKNSILPENFSGNLGIDKNDNIWLGTNEGVFIYDGANWLNYNMKNSILPDNWVQCIAFDSVGNSWLGTANGLVKIKDDEWEVFSLNNSDIGAWDINDIAIDPENNVWVGFFWGQGISKYDGNNWKHYNTFLDTESQGLNALSIDFDKEGNLWIGTTWEGLMQFNEDKIVEIKDYKKNNEVYSFQLYQNYPNPFNPSTTIKYQIPANVKSETSNTKLVIFDILGREVATLVNQQQKAGNYEVKFDASNITSGIYFYKLSSGGFTKTKKMIVLK